MYGECVSCASRRAIYGRKMTSLTYDDSIEIISYHTDDAPSGLGVSATASAASVDGTAMATAYVSFSGRRQLSNAGGNAGRHGVRASVAGRRHPGDSMSPQYRRMRCAVIVMASVMILASMLLVGVSLSMAEHIDELGQLFAFFLMKIIGTASTTPLDMYCRLYNTRVQGARAMTTCNYKRLTLDRVQTHASHSIAFN